MSVEIATETRTITHVTVQARIAWPESNGWEIGLVVRGELEPNQWCNTTVGCEWYFDCNGCADRRIPHCTHDVRYACRECQARSEEHFLAILGTLGRSRRWRALDADRNSKRIEGLVSMQGSDLEERFQIWCEGRFKQLGRLTSVHVDTWKADLVPVPEGWISRGTLLTRRLLPEGNGGRDYYVLRTQPCGCQLIHRLPWPRHERHTDPLTPGPMQVPCQFHEEEHD